MANVFETLNSVNVNDHTEKKKNGSTELTYLSWAWAWAEVKKRYEDASYEIEKFDGIPYVYDPLTGYMVYTRVTIGGITHEMWLPVMDGANKAMKSTAYTYRVKNPLFKYAKKGNDGVYRDKYGNVQEEFATKVCEAATMFDINKTIMRCLVKNLAMFGLGLYIYAGEDIPEDPRDEEEIKAEEKADEIRSEKLGVDRAITLLRQLEDDGITPSVIHKRFGVSKLEDLTYADESDIMSNRDILKIASICEAEGISMNVDALKPAQVKKILAEPEKYLIEPYQRKLAEGA